MVLWFKVWICILQKQTYSLERQLPNPMDGPNYVLGSALLQYCCIYGILELGSSIIPFNWQLFLQVNSLLSWLPVYFRCHSLSVLVSLFVCTVNRRCSELRLLYCCQRIGMKHKKRKQTSRRQDEVSLWSKCPMVTMVGTTHRHGSSLFEQY